MLELREIYEEVFHKLQFLGKSKIYLENLSHLK